MKTESFEHRRILQLSKQLDNQHSKNQRLTVETQALHEELKKHTGQISDEKDKLAMLDAKLRNALKELDEKQDENKSLRESLEMNIKRAEEAEVENVRQRQTIEELKEQIMTYEARTKDVLFIKEQEIALKEKETIHIREENIELEKLYMRRREDLEKVKENQLKDLRKLTQDLESLKRDLNKLHTECQKMIETENMKWSKDLSQVAKKIGFIDGKIQDEIKTKKTILELNEKMEELVIENSQKVIEVYKYKHLLDR